MTSLTPVRFALIVFSITICGHASLPRAESKNEGVTLPVLPPPASKVDSAQDAAPPVPPPPASRMDSAQEELHLAQGALRAARGGGAGSEGQLQNAAEHAKKARDLLDGTITEPRLVEDDRRRLRMQRRTADLIAWHAQHWNDKDTDPAFRKAMVARWEEMRKVLLEDFGPLEGKDTTDRLTAYTALMQTIDAIGHLDPNSKAFDDFSNDARALLSAEGSSQRGRIVLFDATVNNWRAYRARDWKKVLANCKDLVSVLTWPSDFKEFVAAATQQCDTLIATAPENDIRKAWADIRRTH